MQQQQTDNAINIHQKRKRNIPRLVLYSFFFFTMLYVSSLALSDHLQQKSMISILFGVLLCLVIQFRFIGWWGAKEMTQQNLDEIDLVKMKIKGFFGQLNEKQVQSKNMKKYYYFKNNCEDNLFNQQNKELFQSVMEIFRKNRNKQETYQDKITKIGIRWRIFLQKLESILKIGQIIGKTYQNQTTMFQKLTYFSAYNQNDYLNIQKIFKDQVRQNDQNLDQFPQTISWKLVSQLLELKKQHNKNKLKCIVDQVLVQTKGFVEQMKAKNETNKTERDKIFIECGKRRRTSMDIQNRIAQTVQKIKQLQKVIQKLPAKNAGNNVQQVFKKEVQIRLLKIQLQNQQIEKTYANDCIQKYVEMLRKQLIKGESELQNGIKAFNNKLGNFVTQILQNQDKTYQEMQKIVSHRNLIFNVENNHNFGYELRSQSNEKRLLEQHQIYEKVVGRFRTYLNILLKFSTDYYNNFQEAMRNLNNFTQNQRVERGDSKLDQSNRKFLKVCQNQIKNELKISEQLNKLILRQDQYLTSYQKTVKQIKGQVKMTYDRILKINKDSQRITKPSIELHKLAVERQKLIPQLYQIVMKSFNQKINSEAKYIVKIIYQVQQYMQTQISNFQLREIQFGEENPRQNRYSQYSYEYSKVDDQPSETGKGEGIINKLLNVFFKQWSNSHYFHDMIKQEIQIALNRKRPPFVDNIFVTYLKIHQKTQDPIENIIVHQSQPFQCYFDLTLNFKGKIAVHINTRLNFPKSVLIDVKLLITQVKCPLRICFTPFSIGKSYASLLDRPFLKVDYCVKVGNFDISKVPLVSRLIRAYILIKLRKKMMWPKRMTLCIPLAYRNPILLAIKERNKFEKDQRKKKIN